MIAIYFEFPNYLRAYLNNINYEKRFRKSERDILFFNILFKFYLSHWNLNFKYLYGQQYHIFGTAWTFWFFRSYRLRALRLYINLLFTTFLGVWSLHQAIAHVIFCTKQAWLDTFAKRNMLRKLNEYEHVFQVKMQ